MCGNSIIYAQEIASENSLDWEPQQRSIKEDFTFLSSIEDTIQMIMHH